MNNLIITNEKKEEEEIYDFRKKKPTKVMCRLIEVFYMYVTLIFDVL